MELYGKWQKKYIRKRHIAQINDSSIEHITYTPLGKKWVYRFILRHPELRTVIGDDIELSRLRQLDHWFQTVTSIIAEYNVRPEDIYNMDESGFSIGTIEAAGVIVNATGNPSQGSAWPSRVGIGCGVYLRRRKFNFTIGHIQRRDTINKLLSS